MKPVTFFINNQKLVGTLLYPENIQPKNPAVIFLHGWTSSVNKYVDRAKPLVKLGYIVLVFGMRGHGESDGDINTVSRQDNLEDCLAAYDFLASQPEVDKNRIAVVGSSYGGYLACLISNKRLVWKLALKAAALYPDEKFTFPTAKLIENDIKVYRQSRLKTEENRAIVALAQFKGDVLLIQCEHDEVIPPETTQNYLDAVANNKKLTHVVIPDSDHACTRKEWEKEFVEILKKWFARASV